MAIVAPLAVVGGLVVLALTLLALGGFTYGAAGLPRSLQVTSVWLVWGGTLVCFLYSCAPAFSTQCDTWDADLKAYDFGVACIDAIILATCCAVLFTLGTAAACPGLTPLRGAAVEGIAAVLLVAKLAVGIFRLVHDAPRPSGGATTDAPELKVVVMGASTGVSAMCACLFLVQWVQLKESIASTFMAYTASCGSTMDGAERGTGHESLLSATPDSRFAPSPWSRPTDTPAAAAASPLAAVTPLPEWTGMTPKRRD